MRSQLPRATRRERARQGRTPCEQQHQRRGRDPGARADERAHRALAGMCVAAAAPRLAQQDRRRERAPSTTASAIARASVMRLPSRPDKLRWHEVATLTCQSKDARPPGARYPTLVWTKAPRWKTCMAPLTGSSETSCTHIVHHQLAHFGLSSRDLESASGSLPRSTGGASVRAAPPSGGGGRARRSP